MARHHLPFASQEETICRATSAYLLAQYLLKKEGRVSEFNFEKLNDIYKNMQIVNVEVAKRLRNAAEADSAVNAIVLLDFHAQTLPLAIEESLEEIRYIYQPYFDGLAENFNHGEHGEYEEK